MALQECGTLRILFAAFCSVIGKLFHQRGWFYIVAGPKARGIDVPPRGPSLPMTTMWSLPPMIQRHRQEAGHRPGASSGHCGHQRPGGQHPGLLPKRAHDGPAGQGPGGQPAGPVAGADPNRHHPQSLKRTRQKKRVCKKERQKPLLFYHSLQTRSKISLRPDGGAEEMRTASR